MRPPLHHSRLAVLAGLLASAAVTFAASAQPFLAADRVRDRSSAQDDASIIASNDHSLEDRQGAARRLAAATSDQGRESLVSILQGPIEATSPAGLALAAIAEQSFSPSTLAVPLQRRLQKAGDAERPAILRALASIRTRAAARVILAQWLETADARLSSECAAALARLSGRDDLPADPLAWRTWIENAEKLDEASWRAALLAAHTDRADRLARDQGSLAERLTEAYRRLHLTIADGERSAFLAGLIRDQNRQVRDLGFELIARELAAGRSLSTEVSDGAIALLEAPDPVCRAHAARLLAQLAPDSAALPVTAALARETDPSAVAALIEAAARWPSRDLGTLVVRWLTAEPGSRRAAIACCWTLYRAGLLGPAEREQALQCLRSVSLESLGSAACHLLAALGDAQDRAAVGQLLVHDEMSLRRSAAAALATDVEFADSILFAAQNDPELFNLATRVVLMHRLHVDGFEQLRRLPAPSATQHREGLVQVATALPAPDVLTVARNTRASDDREEFLGLLLAEPRLMSERADPSNLRAIVEGAMSLARLRLETDRPDLALAALDPIMPLAPDSYRRALADLALPACLALDRLESAEQLDASADAWLHGLRLCAKRPHARKALSSFTFRFGPTLSDAQMKLLAEIIAMIDAANPPTPRARPVNP